MTLHIQYNIAYSSTGLEHGGSFAGLSVSNGRSTICDSDFAHKLGVRTADNAMAIITPETYRKFLVENRALYPCNQCRITRRAIHVKWLLCEARLDSSVMRNNEGRIVALSTSCFDKNTVTQLILSKQCYPVPPPMEDMLNVLYNCGRHQDKRWYHQVLDWFYWLLKNGREFNGQKIAQDSIEYRVQSVLRKQIGMHDQLYETIMEAWMTWFDSTYNMEGIKCYYYLSVASEHFVIERMHHLVWNTPPEQVSSV